MGSDGGRSPRRQSVLSSEIKVTRMLWGGECRILRRYLLRDVRARGMAGNSSEPQGLIPGSNEGSMTRSPIGMRSRAGEAHGSGFEIAAGWNQVVR